jgi:murein DD-endopeptidase MepM/ murein hydrolase activator NlpD
MADFIKPCVGRLTSPFGWRIHPIRKTRSWHQGIDLAEKGTVPIKASASGTITRTGALGTYGNIVMISHNIRGKVMETNYAHLSRSIVKIGQVVKQGQTIGYMGNTGSSTAQHLHFEIHDGRWATGQPNAVDPMKYIKEEVAPKPEPKKEEDKPVTVPKVDEKNASADRSFVEAQKWVKANKISDGTYPRRAVTRQELWAMLYNANKAGK